MTKKRTWAIARHLTFGVVMLTAWAALSMLNDGIGSNILVVLGSAHLGVVMTRTWPK